MALAISLKVIRTDTDRSAIYDSMTTHLSSIAYRLPSETAISVENRIFAIFFNPRVFNAPSEDVPLGIGYRRLG